MIVFIPSWYGKSGTFKAEDHPWYQSDGAYEFDDTVNQLRMFRRAGEEVALLVPHYAPELACFLHRQALYPLPCISLFDRMQGLEGEKAALFSYLDLPWPKDTEWVFTPYTLVAFLYGEKIAVIQFGEDGNLLWIDNFLHGVRSSRDLYDDRGFLSSMINYQDGSPAIQYYLNRAGVIQFGENLKTGVVTILPEAVYPFQKSRYESLSEMVEEVMQGVFRELPASDTVILAANRMHNELVFHALCGQQVVLAYFGDRFDLSDTAALRRDVGRAVFAITDTQYAARRIQEAVGRQKQIQDISPFDTRLRLGTSQRIRELKIFFPVDGFTGPIFEQALQQVFQYMEENPNVRLLLAMRTAPNSDALAKKQEEIGKILEAGPQKETLVFGKRIQMQPFLSETDLIRILSDVRLILDVRDQPDLYLQIAGISAGIPQINYRYTRYVDHKKDGYIIQNISYVHEALVYYLSQLNHWNEALMYCVEKAENYTSGALVTQWKERLDAGS